MSRWLAVIAGLLLGFLSGALASYAFNIWYTPRYVHGDDDVNFLVALLLLGFLPVGSVLGAWLGYRLSAGRTQHRAPR